MHVQVGQPRQFGGPVAPARETRPVTLVVADGADAAAGLRPAGVERRVDVDQLRVAVRQGRQDLGAVTLDHQVGVVGGCHGAIVPRRRDRQDRRAGRPTLAPCWSSCSSSRWPSRCSCSARCSRSCSDVAAGGAVPNSRASWPPIRRCEVRSRPSTAGTTGNYPQVLGNGVIALTASRVLFRKLVGKGFDVPLATVREVRVRKVFNHGVVGGSVHLVLVTPPRRGRLLRDGHRGVGGRRHGRGALRCRVTPCVPATDCGSTGGIVCAASDAGVVER